MSRGVDLNLPYINMGSKAYNGRTVDERVVNPFLHDRQIPSSKGPYLATFRRSVRFDAAETRQGVRDKAGYDAFTTALSKLGRQSNDEAIKSGLIYILYKFVELRNSSKVPLAKIKRLNLDQYAKLFDALLQTPSGGLLPVVLTVSLLEAIGACYKLQWQIDSQGINVADKASGAGGDVSVSENGAVIFSIEVTERPIDRSRVVSTFNTKISPNGIGDYLFVFTNSAPTADARAAASQYFTQGHDVNFIEIKPWLIFNLATMGSACRANFTSIFLANMDAQLPAVVKVKWNDLVKGLFG